MSAEWKTSEERLIDRLEAELDYLLRRIFRLRTINARLRRELRGEV